MKTYILLSSLVIALQTGCKNRFFFFNQEPAASGASESSPDTRSGQVAIAPQTSSDSSGQNQSLPQQQKQAPYRALQGGSKKNVALGATIQFEVEGQRVDVTFLKVLEDSRCPKDVVCIWEGQARLQFNVSVPALNVSKTVEATLRAGHPELGQVNIGAVALDLVGLAPDTVSQPSTAQGASPEATLVIGKAP